MYILSMKFHNIRQKWRSKGEKKSTRLDTSVAQVSLNIISHQISGQNIDIITGEVM